LLFFQQNIWEFLFIYSLNLSNLLIFWGILFFNIRELKGKKNLMTRMSPTVCQENFDEKKWIDKFNTINSSKSHPNLSFVMDEYNCSARAASTPLSNN